MRTPAITLAIIGLLLLGFCYWGVFTESGSAAFEEMAGMIPAGAGALGALLLLIALILLVITRLRNRK